jgi:hypothetical protein
MVCIILLIPRKAGSRSWVPAAPNQPATAKSDPARAWALAVRLDYRIIN